MGGSRAFATLRGFLMKISFLSVLFFFFLRIIKKHASVVSKSMPLLF
jgi:hypothetical protein